MKEYKTVEFESKDEFVEKKSRFIGYVKPVKTQEEATNFINSTVLYSFIFHRQKTRQRIL